MEEGERTEYSDGESDIDPWLHLRIPFLQADCQWVVIVEGGRGFHICGSLL